MSTTTPATHQEGPEIAPFGGGDGGMTLILSPLLAEGCPRRPDSFTPAQIARVIAAGLHLLRFRECGPLSDALPGGAVAPGQ